MSRLEEVEKKDKEYTRKWNDPNDASYRRLLQEGIYLLKKA